MRELLQRIVRSRSLRQGRAWVNAGILRADHALVRPPAWIAAVACILVLQCALILSHERWLDEYQAALIAVQAPDLATLLDWLRYEGHPPLFYIILRALAHVVEPAQTLTIVALVCATATQLLILLASPFTRAERLLLATSEFVLFEFLTLSRSMTLGVTLIVLVLVCWRLRLKWLFIALLPLCDFLFGVISLVLIVLCWRDKSLWRRGLVGWAVSGAAAAWTVRPPADVVPAIPLAGFLDNVLHFLMCFGTLLAPMQGGLWPRWDREPWPLGGVLWIGFFAFVWMQTRTDRFHRVALFSFIAVVFLFSVAVYPLPIRHLMLVALLLIALTWLRRTQGERPDAGFRLWLAVASLCGLATVAINFSQPFDTSRQAAAEIERLGLREMPWMAFRDSQGPGVAITAVSGLRFERPERHCTQTFIRWDYRTSLTSPARLASYLRREIAQRGRFYLLSEIELDSVPPDVLRQISYVPAGYDGTDFYLYVVGAGQRERHALPACVANARPFARL